MLSCLFCFIFLISNVVKKIKVEQCDILSVNAAASAKFFVANISGLFRVKLFSKMNFVTESLEQDIVHKASTVSNESIIM